MFKTIKIFQQIEVNNSRVFNITFIDFLNDSLQIIWIKKLRF